MAAAAAEGKTPGEKEQRKKMKNLSGRFTRFDICGGSHPPITAAGKAQTEPFVLFTKFQ